MPARKYRFELSNGLCSVTKTKPSHAPAFKLPFLNGAPQNDCHRVMPRIALDISDPKVEIQWRSLKRLKKPAVSEDQPACDAHGCKLA